MVLKTDHSLMNRIDNLVIIPHDVIITGDLNVDEDN